MATSSPTGICFDIQRYALHDGPGIRTTVFLKGCPLTCGWCHNPEGRAADPEIQLYPDRCIACGACRAVCPTGDSEYCLRCGRCAETCTADARRLVGRTLTAEALVTEVARDRPFYEQSGGGATFSGGEPLAQPDFLLACLRGCAEQEIHTAVDTCGYAEAELILEVAALTDLFLYDLKFLDEGKHRVQTGVPAGPVLANLRALDAAGAQIWIRVPVLPGLNDGAGDIDALGTFIAGLRHTRRVHLLPYHRMGMDKYDRMPVRRAGRLLDVPTLEHVEDLAHRLAAYDLQVLIGG